MAFWLRSDERRVTRRAGRVQRDLTELNLARETFSYRVKAELARPKVLLGLFAAGAGYGWLRGRGRGGAEDGDEQSSDDGPKPGRLASVIAAAVAGARIYEQVRRAAALVGSAPIVRPSAAPAQHPADPAEQYQADDRYDPGEK